MIFFENLDSGFLDVFLAIIAFLLALAVAIPFHEFAHAFVAKKEGDYTATAYKRCTPQLHVHFDPVGSLMMLLFGFGWAKPVPIDPRNFKRGRKSLFLVSSAGIIMNFLLGTFFLFIYMLIIRIDANFYDKSYYGYMLGNFLSYSFYLNFGLAIFNFLPIYPFDGYNIISSMCRYNNGYLVFARKYSSILFVLIIITGLYAWYYRFVIGKIFEILIGLFGKMLGLL